MMKKYYSTIPLLFFLLFSGQALAVVDADADIDCVQRYEQLVAEGVGPVEALEQVLPESCGGNQEQATQVAAMALLAVSGDTEATQQVIDIANANNIDQEALLEATAALAGDTGAGGPVLDRGGSSVPTSSGGGGMPPVATDS